MSIITLTTDFGIKDHFVSAVKGAIYTELPQATIVDVSHEISPFHITEAAYIIQNAYKNFPKGSIHIVGIDSELNPENMHIAVKLDDHYFICANNGLISLIASEFRPEKIVKINIRNKISTNFPVLDVFVTVACHIARGGTLEVIGKVITEIKLIKGITPIVNLGGKQIVGSIIYIDNYGNLITNITRKFFEEIGKGRIFKITARSAIFSTIYERYSDAINFDIEKSKREEDGKKLAIFNSSGYLELAIYKSNPKTVGGASSLFGLHYRDTVSISFE
ncbi:S-adenosyl-l-methionine hydroxide adenosyltransferase family protein [Aquimarina sp. RZ0]|uniref:SAM hydrolase/SAM-dependent halogenase family protein n=1 Tax=Aquimarina sp. RZ0 TaxID=2607730 RepID=UPI0011F227AC|nr:SAM-dependent chlorinase/fluorinase [Aquimarina sp. RZ0]KAA1242604.1 SAM-dependent chlorinase/fluorinase [Aquimarina sp. RZ0]